MLDRGEAKVMARFHISMNNNRKLKSKAPNVNYDGAGDGIRTRDTLLGRQELFR
jgi:hypothetical protein